jgi:hypothetical protein
VWSAIGWTAKEDMVMGRDGDWIRAGAAYPAGDGDEWPDDEWSDDEWSDDEWSDDDEWLDDDAPAEPRLGYWGHGSVSGFPVLAVAVVAVVAAIAGAAVGFFLVRGTPVARASAPASALPSSALPSALPSSGRGTGPQARPGLPGSASGNGNGQLRMLLTGRVLAVSGTSITIGGAGPSVTAAVTSATKITGRAHAIASVKVGDQVAAQVAGTPSHLTLTTLQDPTQ